jgi:hypothetical protein
VLGAQALTQLPLLPATTHLQLPKKADPMLASPGRKAE